MDNDNLIDQRIKKKIYINNNVNYFRIAVAIIATLTDEVGRQMSNLN